MIVPERRFLWFLGAVVLGAALVVAFPEWTGAWQGGTVAVLAIAAVDALLAFELPPPTVERRVPGSLSLGTSERLATRTHLSPTRPSSMLCRLMLYFEVIFQDKGVD